MIFLCLVKDKRVDNAHLKFHNISSIFQFIVELAMHGGHWNENYSVCKKIRMGCLYSPWVPWILEFWLFEVDLFFLRWAIITLIGWRFSPHLKETPEKWVVNYNWQFNFKNSTRWSLFGIWWNYCHWIHNTVYFQEIILFLKKIKIWEHEAQKRGAMTHKWLHYKKIVFFWMSDPKHTMSKVEHTVSANTSRC